MNLKRIVDKCFSVAIKIHKDNSAIFEVKKKINAAYDFTTQSVTGKDEKILVEGIWLSDEEEKEVRVRKVAFKNYEIGDLNVIDIITDTTLGDSYKITKVIVKGRLVSVLETEQIMGFISTNKKDN